MVVNSEVIKKLKLQIEKSSLFMEERFYKKYS